GWGTRVANSRRLRDDQRCRELLRHVRSAARRSRLERLGTHAFAPWTARNGSSKICGRRSVAAICETVVVRLQRGFCRRSWQHDRSPIRAELETPSSCHARKTRGSRADFSTSQDLNFRNCSRAHKKGSELIPDPNAPETPPQPDTQATTPAASPS